MSQTAKQLVSDLLKPDNEVVKLKGKNLNAIVDNLVIQWAGHSCSRREIKLEIRSAIKSKQLVSYERRGRRAGYRTLTQQEKDEYNAQQERNEEKRSHALARKAKPRFHRSDRRRATWQPPQAQLAED